MDVGERSLPDSVNPNTFPAKLWRLVNNPDNKAIYWDSLGEVIVIDQLLFEKQILAPNPANFNSADSFKTTNFSSFVRQLNLYGFKKVDPADKDSPAGVSHHFYNPSFKRNHPELVASLRRLTVDNKAKIKAGLDVTCRTPSRYHRIGSSSLVSCKHQESAHPYYPTKSQAMTEHNGTPVPPRYLMRGQSAALSSSGFTTDKVIPVSLNHHSIGVASDSSAVHIQQGLLARATNGNPNFTSFNPCNAQYHPSYYSPVCNCYYPKLVTGTALQTGLQTGRFSPQSYYQAGYPVNMWSPGDQNQELQQKDTQEVKKCDVNLDTVFQIADEVMQTPPINYLVKPMTPEKPCPVLEVSSKTCNATLHDSPSSTMKLKPLCATPIIMAVSGNFNLVTCRQQEESVVSVPEQMPEDAISEVASDEGRDSKVIGVKVNDMDPSQVYSSSCTGSTANL